MSEQKEQKKSRAGMNEAIHTMAKGNKTAGIIIAILMVVLGVLFLARPLITEAVAMYFAVAGFLVYGVFQIIAYFRTPSDQRNGWTIANGIIFIVLSIIILAGSTLDMVITFAFLLGFLAMFGGINQISSYGALKKAGAANAGWVLASGIINLILAIFLLVSPFAAVWSLGYVFGIYLIVGGIALFAEALSGHHGKKA